VVEVNGGERIDKWARRLKSACKGGRNFLRPRTTPGTNLAPKKGAALGKGKGGGRTNSTISNGERKTGVEEKGKILRGQKLTEGKKHVLHPEKGGQTNPKKKRINNPDRVEGAPYDGPK